MNHRRIRVTISLAAAGLLAAGCAPDADQIARGEALAAEKGCVACHGAQGVSQAPAFPNLAGQWPQYLRVQLMKYRSGARQNAVMNAQAAGLTQEEIAALAAFYAAQ
ncbi:MAG: c-type cytochrome [Gammaproteobacteria bacterium]|nr:c-type cytochrome [Gammaproteobacteria bacterium]